MSEFLDGITAVVTGAASGNGRAIALLYAQHGANVVCSDIREEPREGGEPTHEKINETTDAEAVFVEADVSEVSDLEAAVGAAEPLGGIDVMVNNAGIFRREEFFEWTEQEFQQMMDINVKGVYFGSQVAARAMHERGRGGSIINMCSLAGLEGNAGFTTYSASKGAVRLMTYALADELGHYGIRVNAIHPGFIKTQMTTEDVPVVGTEAEEAYVQTIPLGRAGFPEDVARAAVFLASELSEYVSGDSLCVDGGMYSTG